MRRFPWWLMFPLLLGQLPLPAQHVPAMDVPPAPGAIAVPRFAGEFGDTFADMVLSRLLSSGEVSLVERDQLEAAARELKFENSGISNAETAQKLGEMVNARYVLLGRATHAPGGMLQVTVRLVEVATGKLVPEIAASQQIDPEDKQEYQEKLNTIADDLLAALRNARLTIRPPNKQVRTPDRQVLASDRRVKPLTIAANVQVTSTPAGGKVLVDGIDTGKTTPCLLAIELGGNPEGQVDLTIILAGYYRREEMVTVKAGKMTLINLMLAAKCQAIPQVEINLGYAQLNSQYCTRMIFAFRGPVPVVRCYRFSQPGRPDNGNLLFWTLNPSWSSPHYERERQYTTRYSRRTRRWDE